MPEILVTVRDKFAENTLRHMYVCSNSDYQIRFDFDAEWAAHQVKTARFKYGSAYQDVVFTGDICPVPIIENAAVIYVGVYAGDLRTTTAAIIRSAPSILVGNGAPADPLPDVYAQIMAKIDSGVLQGSEGKSAYQVAQENGFVGTEAQWLASLQGPPGDTTAADTAAAAAQQSAEAAQTAAEASAGSAAQAEESVGGLADELAATKAALENTQKDLAKAQRAIKFQAELNQGQTWDFETDSTAAYSRQVPSGAHAGAVLEIGGMSQRDEANNVLIDAPVDEVRVSNAAGDSTVTYTIPQAIRDLCPDYGIGVSADCYNYIDFATKQYHHRAGKYVFDGTENYIVIKGIGTHYRVAIELTIARKSAVKNVLFAPYAWAYNFSIDEKHYYVDGNNTDAGKSLMYVFDTYATIDALRDALIGAVLHYELATPEVIDLSAVWPEDFDLTFATEPGGSITMHYPKADEGYTLDVPAKIQYITKLSEVTANG